jgi:hypothetical protein
MSEAQQRSAAVGEPDQLGAAEKGDPMRLQVLAIGHPRAVVPIVLALLATISFVAYLYLRTIYIHPDIAPAVQQIGALYGDGHPTVVDVDYSKTDRTPMDDLAGIVLHGHFHLGSRRANTVMFTFLAQKDIVFGVAGIDRAGRVVWSHPGQIALALSL